MYKNKNTIFYIRKWARAAGSLMNFIIFRSSFISE